MSENRQMKGFNYFILWFGAAVSLAEIMTGSLLAPLGVGRGITVILTGHLIGTLVLALVGVIGFKEKTPALISSRLSLGRYGSYLVSLFNIVQLLGWTAIMLIQCARSMQAITGRLFGFHSFAALAIMTGVLVAIWALNTDRGINIVNNVAVILLLVLCVVMLRVVFDGTIAKVVVGSISVGAALELSIVMPLSYVPLISDYTMSGKSLRGSFWGSFAGYFLGSSLMFIIGLVSAVYAGTPDPVALMARNMGIAALLIVILSTVTTTFLDVYSAVLSTINITSRCSKKLLIIIFTLLGTMLALYFPMEQYQNFLYLLGSFLAPVFSVVIVDYFWLKEDYSQHFCNIPGLVAATIGLFTYYAFLRADLVVGATLPSMLVTIVCYLVLRYLVNNCKLRSDETCSAK